MILLLIYKYDGIHQEWLVHYGHLYFHGNLQQSLFFSCCCVVSMFNSKTLAICMSPVVQIYTAYRRWTWSLAIDSFDVGCKVVTASMEAVITQSTQKRWGLQLMLRIRSCVMTMV